jgi:hypothetical protein
VISLLPDCIRITAFEEITKGNFLIFARATASVVCIQISFSHFDLLIIVTLPANRMLSMYLGVMGKSVESIEIFCFALLCIDFGDKNSEGLLMLKGVPALSLNCIMYFENCAFDSFARNSIAIKKWSSILFISTN